MNIKDISLTDEEAVAFNNALTSARLAGERTGIIKGLDMAIGKLSERIETNGAPVRTLKELKSDYQEVEDGKTER
jgi:hypothetical protein